MLKRIRPDSVTAVSEDAAVEAGPFEDDQASLINKNFQLFNNRNFQFLIINIFVYLIIIANYLIIRISISTKRCL